jgi:hypothetical protein
MQLGKKRLKVQHKRFQDDVPDTEILDDLQRVDESHQKFYLQSMESAGKDMDDKETMSSDSQRSPLPHHRTDNRQHRPCVAIVNPVAIRSTANRLATKEHGSSTMNRCDQNSGHPSEMHKKNKHLN